ncbi:DUF559 domain-containing protein, partial [Desulfosarcina sp.]|nr:DUF559 domain-containing protein [Desulfosarcina sp.]
QMSQNIISAWLCGARFMELKTIQTLDELEVSKPCIDMQDEGYNCEWSQELKIHESYEQYLNAWIIIHVLKHKFAWNESEELGTIFNMSVGYDLQGILNENVQWFFDKMKNCSKEKKQKIDEIMDLYPEINKIIIPDDISNNITLSTMHGCPPDEIEKIGHYLIEEKKLHTAIKLNPTLLGKDRLHNILKKSGFKTQVPDLAFEHDLKYPEAISIINNLTNAAKKNKVHFGLKLTNTLESSNHKSVFPENQKMMYMSGRALHPLAVNLAYKLQSDFKGQLDISFSAGVNAFNIHNVISSGLTPATVCSDILKPGGYGLLHQYTENLKSEFENTGAASIEEYIFKSSGKKSEAEAVLENLKTYAKQVLNENAYKKTDFLEPSIKTERTLKAFDCIQAPCVDTCPTHQDIPDYLHYVANNDIYNSLNSILRTNPFPQSTGMVCDHLCQTKCTRINYDNPLMIREIKRYVAESSSKRFNSESLKQPKNGSRVSIIGAGPSGLSCSYFLALAGFIVDVYENKNQPGGMVSGAIPAFRLTEEAFLNDVNRIEEVGVKIHYNQNITSSSFNLIRKKSDFIFIATGAPNARKFLIEGIDNKGVLDPLDFLFKVKEGEKPKLGENIIVVGGGNTAMDTARTAYRLADKEAKVSLLYRRTLDQMPADSGEIKAVLEEGVEIQELVLPIRVNSENNAIKSLTCIRMELKGKNSAGRPKPVEIPGSEFDINCDTLLPAIGQDPLINFINPKYLITEPGIYETKMPNVFLGGDALRGASTAINAIGDGRKIAEIILKKAKINFRIDLPQNRKKEDYRTLMSKRMVKEMAIPMKESPITQRKNFDLVTSSLSYKEAQTEASRCLKCDELCNTCVTVCPNLALYSYFVEPIEYSLAKLVKSNGKVEVIPDGKFTITQAPQILHIADWCNECGNCNTFCPTSGAPYKEKPHLYINKQAFEKDDNCYHYDEKEKVLNLKQNGILHQLSKNNEEFNYKINKSEIIFDKNTFKIKSHNIQSKDSVELKVAAEMSIIWEGARDLYGFKLKNEANPPLTKGARGIRPSAGRYIPYNKDLKQYSRNLRNKSTLSEVLLWNELKSKKLGFTFNRQKPLLNYIVDFYCKPLNLVIEVDGSSHYTDEARKRDIKRQIELEKYGLIFLRFDDSEVKKDIKNVIRAIQMKIEELEK